MVLTFKTDTPKDSKNIRVWRLINCPNEIKEQLYAIQHSYYDINYSIIAFDISDNKIYGVILARLEDIRNPEVVTESDVISNFLKSSTGLHLLNIVYANCLNQDILLWMLNECHLSYCNNDLSKDNLYIWTINNGEFILSKTKQEDVFFPNALNEVSRNFMRILL